MKKQLGVLAALVALSGCASTEYAGNTTMEVKQSAGGRGCDLRVQDGKELKSRDVDFDGEKCRLAVKDGDAKAFKGQAIGAKALAVFPVMDLANILKGD